MKYILIFTALLFLFSCKRDLFTRNNPQNLPPGKVLSINEAQRFLKKSLKTTFSQRIVKIASSNPVDLSDITDNMADSVYAKFYWDYAVEEHMIDGYPAILVPMIMREEINSSVMEDMSPKGYRVAVFQHTYEKDGILISFRDYHPDEQLVMARMVDREIPVYPSNFIQFYDVLGDDFSGHILYLNNNLSPTRLAEVVDNVITEYLNIPFTDTTDENPLILYPYEDIFEGTDKQCKIQIVYPDFEISYSTQRYSSSGAVGQIGSNLTGFAIYGMDIGLMTIANYTTIWNTETFNTGGCSSGSGGGGFSNGVAVSSSGAGPGPGDPINRDDCLTKGRLAVAMRDKLKLDSVNNAVGADGKAVEAGYNVTIKDIYKRDETTISPIYNNNDPTNVNVPFSWNAVQGYTIHATHSHPGGMPHSIRDIFVIGFEAHMVATHPHSVELQKIIFQESYTDVVEIGNNEFYAITISDINKLINKTFGISTSSYLTNLQASLTSYQEYLNGELETAEHRLTFLLDHFGDAITLYKGERDEHGYVQTFDKLNLTADKNVSSEEVDCES
ncbi:hypothetical protein FAZ15_08620 [Sphingobacterium olei]|uniref:Uncharacterized protein n=1 Tax=Sphingobacterium olei TaxID=2571155 RepID=A0A4U0P3Q9_9SPHI|nr:hypothetical protein [Sphingobacterium olei]TJZ61252.1 hypothetical protein FAZ15_08620 [Sphingobacterium olei]